MNGFAAEGVSLVAQLPGTTTFVFGYASGASACCGRLAWRWRWLRAVAAARRVAVRAGGPANADPVS